MKTTAAIVLAISTMTNPTDITERSINVDNSTITWKGHKIGGTHTGHLGIKSGSLNFQEDELIGGKVIVDMTSIEVTDLTGEGKGQLEGHLKSDDFFGVATYSEAILEFTKVEKIDSNTYKVTGDLTIKNKTNSISFELNLDTDEATTALKIDRSKYDVRYGSKSFFNDLKDKVIYDDFDLEVNLSY